MNSKQDLNESIVDLSQPSGNTALPLDLELPAARITTNVMDKIVLHTISHFPLDGNLQPKQS